MRQTGANRTRLSAGQRFVHVLGRALVPLLIVGSTSIAHAELAARLIDIPSTPFADSSTRLTLAELDTYRGGFVSEGGFEFSFGLTNYHQINDDPVVAQTLFSIDRVIGRIGQSTLRPDPAPRAATPVTIQLGPGNRIDAGLIGTESGLARTIIQNSLDDQLIRNTNVYDFQLSNVRTLTHGLTADLRRSMIQRQLVDTIR